MCGSVTTIIRNCVHRSSPNWICTAKVVTISIIKFWPSCAPGKGVCGGAKIFGSALLQPARSVCVSPSVFLIQNCFRFVSKLCFKASSRVYYLSLAGFMRSVYCDYTQLEMVTVKHQYRAFVSATFNTTYILHYTNIGPVRAPGL